MSSVEPVSSTLHPPLYAYPVNEHFGIKVATELTTIKARILNPPTLNYGHCYETQVYPTSGVWNMKDKVVASMYWPGITKYKGLISAQTCWKEIIEDLYNLVRDLLNEFIESTNVRPAKVLFYRYGVGEGEFEKVLSTEVEAVKKAC
ncbi:protein argonaute 1D-like isoform X3 [Nicotiana tabacum]|uniref:Protein argonaute 1D-like isoform X3 n=1 Tax=Nicotiana tabacum TaxID=4097 RepID=A0AC58SPW0_TOBAC